MAKKEPTSEKTYQDLKNDLEAVLAELQHEDTDVDKAVELHKQGQKILKELEIYLGKVEKNIKSE